MGGTIMLVLVDYLSLLLIFAILSSKSFIIYNEELVVVVCVLGFIVFAGPSIYIQIETGLLNRRFQIIQDSLSSTLGYFNRFRDLQEKSVGSSRSSRAGSCTDFSYDITTKEKGGTDEETSQYSSGASLIEIILAQKDNEVGRKPDFDDGEEK